MNTDEPILSYRVTRKVRIGGSRVLCILGILLGIVFLLFIFWPVGIAIMIISALVDAKTRLISICGHCGNEVAHTSELCPTCHADLAPEPRKGWFR